MNIIDNVPPPVEVKNYTPGNRMGLALMITCIAIIALETLSSLLIYKSFVSLPQSLRSIIFTFNSFSTSISLTAFEALLMGASTSAVASGVIGTILFLKKQKVNQVLILPFNVEKKDQTYTENKDTFHEEKHTQSEREKSIPILIVEHRTVEQTPNQTFFQTNLKLKNEPNLEEKGQANRPDPLVQPKTDESLDPPQPESEFLKKLRSKNLKKGEGTPKKEVEFEDPLVKQLRSNIASASKNIKDKENQSTIEPEVKEEEWIVEPIKIASPEFISQSPVIQPIDEVALTLKETIQKVIESEKHLKNWVTSFEIQDEGTANEKVVVVFNPVKSCGPARTRLSYLLKEDINNILFVEDREKGDKIVLNFIQITKLKNSCKFF